jgi:hypothetical protein
MKATKLKALYEKHTDADGNVNFDEVSKEVNEFADGVKAKATKGLVNASEHEAELFKELGIEGVSNATGLKSYLEKNKGTADEIATKNTTLANDLATAQKELEKIKTEYDGLNGKVTTNERKSTLTELGFKPEGMDRALKSIVASLEEGQDFKEAAEAFASDEFNSAYVTPPKDKPNFSNNTDKNVTSNEMDASDFAKAFRAGAGIPEKE